MFRASFPFSPSGRGSASTGNDKWSRPTSVAPRSGESKALDPFSFGLSQALLTSCSCWLAAAWRYPDTLLVTARGWYSFRLLWPWLGPLTGCSSAEHHRSRGFFAAAPLRWVASKSKPLSHLEPARESTTCSSSSSSPDVFLLLCRLLVLQSIVYSLSQHSRHSLVSIAYPRLALFHILVFRLARCLTSVVDQPRLVANADFVSCSAVRQFCPFAFA